MEVSQAIWLIMFLFNALLISPKRFDEIILDFYQDAGIWIVIASCVAEYLLLLTYIGVAAYDFFKNRKMMKKMNVQRRTYEFLKFDESHRDVGNRLIRHPEISSHAGAIVEPQQITKPKKAEKMNKEADSKRKVITLNHKLNSPKKEKSEGYKNCDQNEENQRSNEDEVEKNNEHKPSTKSKHLKKKANFSNPRRLRAPRAQGRQDDKVLIIDDLLAPNNPQLLKFDGEPQQTRQKKKAAPLTDGAARMNKSLKRKQIE